LLSGILAEILKETAFLKALIENDLALLAPLHGVNFSHRPIRLEAVRLNVPALLAKQAEPYACEVDWAEVRTWMESSAPVGPGGSSSSR
jgi:hypothetical protein